MDAPEATADATSAAGPKPRVDQRLLLAALLAVMAVGIFLATLLRYPFGVDWHFTYRPAALALLAGKSPFAEVPLYFTSPWSLIPLIPFAVLPESIGRSLWLVVSLGMFAYIAYRLGGSPWGTLAFLLSPPVTACLAMGNVEWLVLLGLIVPPQIGLILLAIKPQSTLAIMLFIGIEAWRKGGLREAIRISWPVALVAALSLLVFGLWPLKTGDIYAAAGPNNVSVWPMGIPIGAVLLFKALRQHKRELAMIASPFFSPYAILLAWSGAMAGLLPSTVDIVVASAASWVFWLIYRLSFG